MTTTSVTSAITPDNDSIIAEIHIAAPPERVFKALTDERDLASWFRNPGCPEKFWQVDARLGGRYHYATEKGAAVVNNVNEFACHGEILEIDPPRLLVYTWIANWHDDKSPQHHRPLGTDTYCGWYFRQGHAQRLGAGTCRAQGLQRWLARRT